MITVKQNEPIRTSGFSLTNSQHDKLDEMASYYNMNRSELLRELITVHYSTAYKKATANA